MESILSMHDEVCPLKSRRTKSTTTYPNTKKNSVNNKTNIFFMIYQCIKKIILQRSLYILGILNLILAAVAILCVTQAEDHPEYFSLVYIAVSIFIFYMGTIVFIIILQIIEAYREQNKKTHSSLVIQIPLLTSNQTIQSNPVIVESITTKTQPKTRLIRSHTLPLKLTHHNFSTSTSSSTLKEFNQSTRSKLLPKYQLMCPDLLNNYQSFALTTNDQLCPSYTTITHSDSNTQLSPLIKPIPFTYHGNKSKIQFLDY
jgi:hypothetical protein